MADVEAPEDKEIEEDGAARPPLEIPVAVLEPE